MRTKPVNLRCEYLENPLGIDAAKPSLSWEIADSRRGARQTAYLLLAASSLDKLKNKEGDLWDSGRIESPESINIEYNGKILASATPCFWEVKVWTTTLNGEENESDWSEHAFFSTGLLDEEDWKSSWITAPEFIPDEPVHIGYMSLETDNALEPKWVQIDLGSVKEFDQIKLYPTAGRRGDRAPGGEIPPGDGFPLQFKIETSSHADMESCEVIADYSGKDVLNPAKEPFEIRFAKTSGRYVRVTALKHASFFFANKIYCFKLAEVQVISGEENVALGCSATTLDSCENLEEGYGATLLTDGKTCYDPGFRRHIRPSPLLRGEFLCHKRVRRAEAFATALGNYELYINGDRIGDHWMAPGYTQYDKRVAVQAYDVTSLLRQGNNAAGVVLADGWYRSRYRLDGYDQFKDFVQGRFGDAIPRFLLQINIDYEDGTKETAGTDGTWTYSLEGPYRKTSMYDGIVYDSRRESAGWCSPGFCQAGWSPALVCEPSWKLIRWPQTVQPIRLIDEFKPVSIRETAPGRWLCDFGQGIGGSCRIALDGPEGMTVKLHHVMALNEDGTLYTRSLWGSYNNADIYTLNGKGTQTFAANFTFHGFRYVEISGMESIDNLVDITALMVADSCSLTATLETSDRRFDGIWKSIAMTYLSCLKGTMVDVADRDERWGWMGDCFTVHTQALAYLFDMPAFFRKRCLDLMDDQLKEGYFPCISPEMKGGGPSAVWSDAALTLAWTSWMNYKNKRLLYETYPAIKKYMHLLKSKYERGEAIWTFHWGDWLAAHMTLRPGATDWRDKGPEQIDQEMMQKLCLIYIAKIFKKIADVLDDDKESQAMGEFVNRLCHDSAITRIFGLYPVKGAQTAYAFALEYEVAGPDEAISTLDNLLKAIEDYGRNMTTGTVSTNALLKVLSGNSHHELAYNLALKPEFPSFGFMFDQGATVLWERFDSYIPGMGFNTALMNGLNHMGLCSVADWIFRTVSGICPDPANPAYKNVIIEPMMQGPVSNARASFKSVYGEVVSKWKKEEGKIKLELVIPPNATATVRIPVSDPGIVTESGQAVTEAEGVDFTGFTQAVGEYKVKSGRYIFDF